MKTVGVVAAAWILSSMPAALRAEGVNDAQIASIALTRLGDDRGGGVVASHGPCGGHLSLRLHAPPDDGRDAARRVSARRHLTAACTVHPGPGRAALRM